MAITIFDVAREASCSINTVSRALNNLPGVSPGTRERVVAVAARLDYTPSRAARSLQTKATLTLGLVVTDCTNPFYAQLIRAVEDTSSSHGYGVMLCNSGEDQQREVDAIRLLLESRVDGILLTPVQFGSAHIASLLERRVPFVLVGRRFEHLDTCYVTGDNLAGGRMATEHLLWLGHRRIGHISGRPEISSVRERLAGYVDALRRHGLSFDETLVGRAERDVAGGRAAALELLTRERPPTAIFAYNDLQALGVMQAVRELGLRIPADVAVVGYDNIELSAYFEVPLSTVAQPTYAIGRAATEMLLGIVRRRPEPIERTLVLAPEIVLRASSGARVRSPEATA